MSAPRSGRIALLFLVLAAACLWLMVGCGGASIVAPDDPREQHVLDETARFAAVLHVNVRGAITDHVYNVRCSDGTMCPAAGLYEDGVAYYWRPILLEKDLAYGTALAAHEVAHSLFESEAGANACAALLVGGQTCR